MKAFGSLIWNVNGLFASCYALWALFVTIPRLRRRLSKYEKV